MSVEERKVVYDFQFKAIVEATNTLLKLTTVYFILVGASLGYLFEAALEVIIVKYVVAGLLIISFLFSVVCLALSYGVVRGLKDIRIGLSALDPFVAEETNIVNFIKRGSRVSLVSIFCCIGIVITICIGMVVLMWQRLP